ncbi:NAD(P)/FAD-dependent oxidoreductase [Actinosynnema sp. NPDC047251]|uniref:FAD dependent oxidoreductase n=1 Tax=Saccharothrix espanaensis (strain ATCC 51144 / DSM 44229 / JCM 9112 / NBRC 15066 / NRRL 15764) TaxID=1179773 RepID=K0K5N9_SACES|nr:NAD(P)/FAD-dependent oxidoreductase [Saccharothrix espanaensis]CCH31878.1 FAD dependent oxidoreductase [Saccharothrix espanaensis DSM 44229]
MYDVIVVGARCAGAPTALLFARAGRRVLLVDRAKFPSDKLSTLYIQQPGVARLAKWGVLDAVRATGCPPLDHVVYELGDTRVEGCCSGVDGQRAAYAPRRELLDRILVDAAVAAGVEFRDDCRVTELYRDGDRVVGVRCESARGSSREDAALVVGADGMRSAVAELVGAEKTAEHPPLTCAYYTFWRGPKTHFEMYEGDTGWVSAVPTNDDAVLVAAYAPQHRFDEIRRDAFASYQELVRVNAPELWAQVEGAEQVGKLHGTGDQQNFFRRAHGPGWALVGDAGHHKDSLTARGISDALMQAELLVETVGDALGDRERQDAAAAEYDRLREERLTENYAATLLIAQEEARPKRRALLGAIGTSPELTTRYFDAVAGIVSVRELYTPELMALMAGAAASESTAAF